MAENLDNQQVYTARVKAQTVYNEVAGRPFKKNQPDHSPGVLSIGESATTAVRKGLFSQEYATTPHDPSLTRKSEFHGRNVTKSLAEHGTPHAFWTGDLPGDKYGERTVKGIQMTNVHIEEDTDSPYGVHTSGLMDGVFIERVKKGSRVLRSLGLPTENPREVKELKEIWVDRGDGIREKISVKEWKKREIKRLERKVKDEEKKDVNSGSYLSALRILKNAREYLKETRFVVLERDVQVDTRITDISAYAKQNRLGEIMSPMLRWLNVATAYTNEGLISGTPQPERFDTSPESLRDYFGEWLPSQMGVYLGRMHKERIYHGYLHLGNWQGVGTPLDLDSLKGKKIYPADDDFTEKKAATDIFDTTQGLSSFIDQDLYYTDEFQRIDTRDVALAANISFFKNYLKERFGEDLKIKDIDDLKDQFMNYETRSWSEYVLTAIATIRTEFAKEHGIDAGRMRII